MNALLEVALFLVVGRVLASSGRLPGNASSTLMAWVLYVAWPAAALRAAPLVSLDSTLLRGAAWFWALFAMAAIGVALAIAVLRWKRPTAGAVLLACGTGSTAGFALPFIEANCGVECVAPAIVLSVIGGALAFSVLGVAASCALSRGTVCVRLIAHRVVTFPPLVALLLGVLLPAAAVPATVQMSLHDLAATLAPVSIVSIGMHLRWLPDRTRLGPIVAALSFKLVLAPAAVLAGIALLGFNFGGISKLLVLLAAMPPLISAVAVAREYDLEPELSAQIAAFGATLALVTLPLWGVAVNYVL